MSIYMYKIAPRGTLESTIEDIKEGAKSRGETLKRIYISKSMYEDSKDITSVEVCVLDTSTILAECEQNLYPDDKTRLEILEKRVDEIWERLGY